MGMVPGIGLVGSVGQSKACRMIFANFDNQNRLVKSTDLGLTFSILSVAPVSLLVIVAISDDGKYVAGLLNNPGYGYSVYLSSDSGVNWTNTLTFTSSDIFYYAMDGTGQFHTVYKIGSGSYTFYRSTDWGSSFTTVASTSSSYSDTGCMSDGGVYQYFNVRTKIWKSSNSGVSWSSINLPSSCRYLQCNATGAKLVCTSGVNIVYSNDYGQTWSTYYTGFGGDCRVGISRDGQTIVAVSNDDGSGFSQVIISTDGGANYISKPQITGSIPVSINISKDGKVIVFADNNTTGLRKSIDFCTSWSIIYVAGNGSNSVMNAGV